MADNEAITFNGISFSSSKQLATKLKQQFNTSKLGRHYRVPTVMENPGKSWKKKLSWKVMEKSWKLKKINKVMETEKS